MYWNNQRKVFVVLCSCIEARNQLWSMAAVLQLDTVGQIASVTLSSNTPPHLQILISLNIFSSALNTEVVRKIFHLRMSKNSVTHSHIMH